MLTVKWQYRLNGCRVERLFRAEEVTAAFRDNDPGKPVLQVAPKIRSRHVDRALVILDDYDISGQSFDCGKIYVMNDHGSTVASYDLGDPDMFEAAEPPAHPHPALAA